MHSTILYSLNYDEADKQVKHDFEVNKTPISMPAVWSSQNTTRVKTLIV